MSVLSERKGEIHLGTLITAFARLGGDPALPAEAIAACLGFGLAAPDMAASATATPTIYDHSRPLPLPRADRIDAPRPTGRSMSSAAAAATTLPKDVLPSELVSLAPLASTDTAAIPAWLSEPCQRVNPTPAVSPPRQTLFPARTVRGVLTAALASWRPGDEIDVDQLIRCVVERRPLERLPRRPSPTLNNGCQLLLDFSDSMVPWWEDLRELARQVSGVLGEERVSIFDFTDMPASARRWRQDTERLEAWFPEAGRSIVLATDFGIRGEPVPCLAGSGWKPFVDLCAARGCPLLILVPWSRAYWPKDLGLHPQLVHWHPGTSATMLRRQRGIAHRIQR